MEKFFWFKDSRGNKFKFSNKKPLACTDCGELAECMGKYENMTTFEPACSECCAHGCEDGYCVMIEDLIPVPQEELPS